MEKSILHIWAPTWIAVIGFCLLIVFQNFETLPLQALKPALIVAEASAHSPSSGEADMRRLAPRKPASIDEPRLVSPEQGTDLNSISQDWLQRQAKNITGGADEKLVADVNKRLNRWLKFEPVQSEPWPDGSSDPKTSPNGGTDGSGDSGSQDDEKSDWSGLKPTQLRVVSLNKFDLRFANESHISCLVSGRDTQWELSKSINQRVDINIRHDTSSQSNSLRLNYNW